MPKPDYDTTLARIAGNIAGNMLDRVLVEDIGRQPRSVGFSSASLTHVAEQSVALARAIVDEVKRTAPVSPTDEWVAKSQIRGGSAIAEKIDNLGNPSKNEQAPSRSIDG